MTGSDLPVPEPSVRSLFNSLDEVLANDLRGRGKNGPEISHPLRPHPPLLDLLVVATYIGRCLRISVLGQHNPRELLIVPGFHRVLGLVVRVDRSRVGRVASVVGVQVSLLHASSDVLVVGEFALLAAGEEGEQKVSQTRRNKRTEASVGGRKASDEPSEPSRRTQPCSTGRGRSWDLSERNTTARISALAFCSGTEEKACGLTDTEGNLLSLDGLVESGLSLGELDGVLTGLLLESSLLLLTKLQAEEKDGRGSAGRSCEPLGLEY